MFKNDTIAAVATPSGEGGIAVIRISGPASLATVARIFRPHKYLNLASAAGYTVRYGRFVGAAGEAIDDGLATVFRAPHSYTGEDVVELSCHGGRAVTDRLLAAVLAAGARLAEPGEFTLRAFLNGRMDLAQAEAVADLIRARTDGAMRVARRQLDGHLSHAVNAVRHELIGILAAIEVTIDFSDEVGELEYGPLQTRITRTRTEVERMLATADRSRMLREGLQVALVGPPNVGKSSLLNALLHTERAIVTPVPGTTRDLIEEAVEIAGVRVNLVDTAGLRDTCDLAERIGVDRARRAGEEADVTLLVLDATRLLDVREVGPILDQFKSSAGRAMVILNKCDLVRPTEIDRLVDKLATQVGSVPVRSVSALTGAGLSELEAEIVKVGGIDARDGTAAEDAVVASLRHKSALQTALASLDEAERTAIQGLPGDFIAIDIRGALDALGLVTGDTVTDEIIHRIFQDFCVGK